MTTTADEKNAKVVPFRSSRTLYVILDANGRKISRPLHMGEIKSLVKRAQLVAKMNQRLGDNNDSNTEALISLALP